MILSEEEKRELRHLENREPRTDYQVWFDVNEYDLRIAFCNMKNIKPYSAVKGTELEPEFMKFCIDQYNLDLLDIEIDVGFNN